MMTQALTPVKHDRAAYGAYRRLDFEGAARPLDIEMVRRDADERFQRPRGAAFLAEPSVGFIAQQIAQEQMGDGAHIEDYRPAVIAYGAAAGERPTISLLA